MILLNVLMTINAGLLIIDHIHFQYNGMLIGILLLTIDFCFRRQYLLAAATFSCLVCMKHLFVYLAPIFGVYLLRNYCTHGTDANGNFTFQFFNFTHLTFIALAVLTLTFGPFIVDSGMIQLTQILRRLFPFGRGLVHSFWAPNFWALYCGLDKVLAKVLPRISGEIRTISYY